MRFCRTHNRDYLVDCPECKHRDVKHVTDGVHLTYIYAVLQLSPRRYQLIRSCVKQGETRIFELKGKPSADYFDRLRQAEYQNRRMQNGLPVED